MAEESQQPRAPVSWDVLELVVEQATKTTQMGGHMLDALEEQARETSSMRAEVANLTRTCAVMSDRMGQVLENRRLLLRFLYIILPIILPFVAGVGVAGGWWASPDGDHDDQREESEDVNPDTP